MTNTLKLTPLALLLMATPLAAQDRVSNAQVEDFYTYYVERIPETKRVCQTVQVPVYGTRNKGASGGDILGGMILGGLLGKVVTGNDKGAAAGAVIGGVATADRNKTERVVTGYRDELQCETVETFEEVNRKQYDYSIITFVVNGKSYQVTFEK